MNIYIVSYIVLAFFPETKVLMSVSADEYEEKMNAEAQFKLTATCRVVESQRLLATSEAFSLRRPALEFEVSSCFVQLKFEP